MNLYIVVEGEKATKKIYKTWIPLINPSLYSIDYTADFHSNNYYILAGFGQPRIFDRIRSAIEDVNKLNLVDRLVISMDSEESSYQEKRREVEDYVNRFNCRIEVRYIIQHFCLETWLLGNKTTFRKQPQNKSLREYLHIFDVRHNDPELLTSYPKNSWNRSQFAFNYLRAGIRDLYSDRKSYTKHNPGITATQGYFNQVKERHLKEMHIPSFSDFIQAFTD